ncbi:NnrU family protein [Candidatus Spongiihabitans sp.]|uniref:NnrU family protein n=1 Tax=Candidatus Spongiihabitans sp. TaxID=3101308 RepID=UPI003C6FE5D3
MTWLIVGIVVFFGIHLFPANPSLREKLVHSIGELPYKGVFAALSFAGLALMIKGMGATQYMAVWHPPVAAATATAVFMAPALILLVAMNFDNNIKRIVRHPMMWGVLLWSLSHLLAIGIGATAMDGGSADTVGNKYLPLVLFGSFAVYALFYLYSAKQRAAPKQPNSTKAAIKTTPIKRDVLAFVIGLIAYALLVAFHDTLFGVAVFF